MLSVKQAAEQLGVAEVTVRRACKRHKIGTLFQRTWILETADVTRLRAVVRTEIGNPNFVAGNYFGKPRKKKRKK